MLGALFRQITKFLCETMKQLILLFRIGGHVDLANGRDGATTTGKLQPFLIRGDFAQYVVPFGDHIVRQAFGGVKSAPAGDLTGLL